MMTGAKIILHVGIDAARDGLASLAGASWIMSLPLRQAAYGGHPAGRGLPGHPADGGAALIAVTFGEMTAPAADHVILPVRWEPVEPDDQFTVQLEGSVILAPATAQGYSALTLSGGCQVPPGVLTAGGRDQVRLELIEAEREFIASVARDITPNAGNGSLGECWGW
jgi:hypothetical protein